MSGLQLNTKCLLFPPLLYGGIFSIRITLSVSLLCTLQVVTSLGCQGYEVQGWQSLKYSSCKQQTETWRTVISREAQGDNNNTCCPSVYVQCVQLYVQGTPLPPHLPPPPAPSVGPHLQLFTTLLSSFTGTR